MLNFTGSDGRAIDGRVAIYPLGERKDGIVLYCHDEGMMYNAPINLHLSDRFPVYGPVVVSVVNEHGHDVGFQDPSPEHLIEIMRSL
jgi:hypothetical protein